MPEIFKSIDRGDLPNDVIAVRLPASGEADIEWGARLFVWPDQEAVFVRSGQITAVFGPGEYTLTTQNVPVLTKFLTGLVMGKGNTPWKARIYFVNKKIFPGIGWGTPQPVDFADPLFFNLQIMAYGTVNFKISDSTLFATNRVGSSPIYRVSDLQEYIRPLVTDAMVDTMTATGKSFQELNRIRRELGMGVKSLLTDRLATEGIELNDVVIGAIKTTPEAMEKIEKYSAAKADALAMRERGTAEADVMARKNEAKFAGEMKAAGSVDPARAALFGQMVNADMMKGMAQGGGGEGGGGAVNQGLQLGMAMMVPQMMQNMMHNQPGSPTSPPPAAQATPPVDPNSPAAKLKQLKALLDEGILTKEEFDAKKAELLKQL